MAKILAVNVDFVTSSDLLEVVEISSNRSLDDADIVLFQPSMGLEKISRTIVGHQAIMDRRLGLRAKEVFEHWKVELERAVKNGKLVIILLAAPQEEIFPTGQTLFSGTPETNQLVKICSYDSLPFDIEVSPLEGNEIQLVRRLPWIDSYWQKFADNHSYECILVGEFDHILATRSKDKFVGGFMKYGGGYFVLLPTLKNFPVEDLLNQSPADVLEERQKWQLRFQNSIIAMHDKLVGRSDKSKEPDWLSDGDFTSKRELEIAAEVDKIDCEINRLREEQILSQEKIECLNALKHLLYENGSQLEVAVRAGLEIFGFDVSHFQDGTYEFDVVLSSPEGRALGECEGKDNKAIKLEKIRQLHDNIEQDYDLQGEDAVYAKPVLFGNAFRLLPVSERPDFFSRHCLNKAVKDGVALVRTTDMYSAVKYLLDNPDDEKYKLKCRLAILETEGKIVEFPSVKSV